MAANARNRKGARHLIGDGLRAKLVGAGYTNCLVLDHYSDVEEWDGQVPFLMVVTTSSSRAQRWLGTGNFNSKFHFSITWVVADRSLESTPQYTSAMSDDTLDDLEKLVSDWIAENFKSAEWTALNRDGPSTREFVAIGKAYKVETINVTCDPVYDA